MVDAYITLHSVSVILPTIFGLLALITGMILATASEGPGSGKAVALGLRKSDWNTFHEIMAFIAAGVAVLHVLGIVVALFAEAWLLLPIALRGIAPLALLSWRRGGMIMV